MTDTARSIERAVMFPSMTLLRRAHGVVDIVIPLLQRSGSGGQPIDSLLLGRQVVDRALILADRLIDLGRFHFYGLRTDIAHVGAE